MNTQPIESMSDDEILDEVVETVRAGRNTGTWDRERLRAVSEEARKRNLLTKPKEV